MNKKNALTSILLLMISCAEANQIGGSVKPNKPSDLPSYHFNSMEIRKINDVKKYKGEYYVEDGFRSWTITINNISTKYSTFEVDHQKFLGNDCENYPASQSVDGKLYGSQIYICNDGNDVYQTFTDATLHFYNEKIQNPPAAQ